MLETAFDLLSAMNFKILWRDSIGFSRVSVLTLGGCTALAVAQRRR